MDVWHASRSGSNCGVNTSVSTARRQRWPSRNTDSRRATEVAIKIAQNAVEFSVAMLLLINLIHIVYKAIRESLVTV